MNLFTGLSGLSHFSSAVSRSISAENFTGEKGKGGMATEGTGKNCARDLGQGWKVSPSIVLNSKEVFEIANISGPGIIKHIWIVDDCKKNRKLVLRIYVGIYYS